MDAYDRFVLQLANSIRQDHERANNTPVDEFLKHVAGDQPSSPETNVPDYNTVGRDRRNFHMMADQAEAWRNFMDNRREELLTLENNSGGEAGVDTDDRESGFTSTMSPVSPGDTTIAVFHTIGFAEGDIAIIDEGTAQEEHTLITGIGSLIVCPLQFAHPAGASVRRRDHQPGDPTTCPGSTTPSTTTTTTSSGTYTTTTPSETS